MNTKRIKKLSAVGEQCPLLLVWAATGETGKPLVGRWIFAETLSSRTNALETVPADAEGELLQCA